MFDRRPVETEKIQGQTTTQAAAESSCLSKQLPAMATRPETGQTFVLWLLDLQILSNTRLSMLSFQKDYTAGSNVIGRIAGSSAAG
jgi:hypothetical protein